jgi:hypothetical protein
LERGAEFHHSGASSFHGNESGDSDGGIEKQDDTVEFAATRAPRKREANGKKEVAAARRGFFLERIDDGLEAIRIHGRATQDFECERANHGAIGGLRTEERCGARDPRGERVCDRGGGINPTMLSED